MSQNITVNLNDKTKLLNNYNINNVREMINKKNGFDPYFTTHDSVTKVITDYNHFPYTRYNRGSISEFPIVAEREAGFRERYSNKKREIPRQDYPNHCFQTACSTVYPCYPEYLEKISDKELMDVELNKSCINIKR
jgi:hypothetical protein